MITQERQFLFTEFLVAHTNLVCILFLVAFVIPFIAYAADPGGKITGTWGKMKGEAELTKAAPPANAIKARPIRALPVAPGVRLWVLVFPAPGGEKGPPPGKGPKPEPDICIDENDQGDYELLGFKPNNTGELDFNINYGSIPIDETPAVDAIRESFDRWEDPNQTGPIEHDELFGTIADIGGAPGPALDGINTVGWVRIVPPNVVAATWVWVDDDDVVMQADIFFNNHHDWAVLTGCREPVGDKDKFDVQGVGTHEVGHVLGQAHIKDEEAFSTMFPKVSKGVK